MDFLLGRYEATEAILVVIQLHSPTQLNGKQGWVPATFVSQVGGPTDEVRGGVHHDHAVTTVALTSQC